MRGTYAYWDFDQRSEARRGDLEFNIFRLFVDLASKGFLVSAQYRWYSYMHVIHHGWVGYDVPVNRGPLSMLTFYNDFRLGHMSGRSKSWSSLGVNRKLEKPLTEFDHTLLVAGGTEMPALAGNQCS